MAEVIRMPKMSDTMTEGVISRWLVKPGDTVESGAILAEVETDKAVMELESYEDGVILHIGIENGQSVPVDGILAVVGEENEKYEHLLENNPESSENSQAQPSQNTASPSPPPPTNAVRVLMPKMSDTMTEGVISKWLVKVGDAVEAGNILAEVETDKATMELECYEDGEILYLGAEEGKAVKVDDVIAIIGERGADFQILLESGNEGQAAPSPEPESTVMGSSAVQANETDLAEPRPLNTDDSPDRIRVSPLARRLANERGYLLQDITGTGKYGRIIKRDIENYKPTQVQSQTTTLVAQTFDSSRESFEDRPISQMRSSIAKNLSNSKFTAPHFYINVTINMDEAIKARKMLNATADTKISFNDLVVKAAALSLREHPNLNAQWLDTKIRYFRHIHVGVAVAIEDGLIVPVVRFADQKGLGAISTEVKSLAKDAKERKLQPEAWQGSTFTISNLGMFGVDSFTAIINVPNSCILAVGGISAQPVVKDGVVVAGNIMKVTLSCDHRIVDGATGAKFLQTFKRLLENPLAMLL